jgi:hypothetical protein
MHWNFQIFRRVLKFKSNCDQTTVPYLCCQNKKNQTLLDLILKVFMLWAALLYTDKVSLDDSAPDLEPDDNW